MKLRWFIEVNGTKTLQYWCDKESHDSIGYWEDVDIELQVTKEYEEKRKLRARIRELENDYQTLIEGRK